MLVIRLFQIKHQQRENIDLLGGIFLFAFRSVFLIRFFHNTNPNSKYNICVNSDYCRPRRQKNSLFPEKPGLLSFSANIPIFQQYTNLIYYIIYFSIVNSIEWSCKILTNTWIRETQITHYRKYSGFMLINTIKEYFDLFTKWVHL